MEIKYYNSRPLIVGNSYNVKGQFWEYVGDFNSIKEVPEQRCCYTVQNGFFIRRHIEQFTKSKDRRRRVDDEKPIDITIRDNDNTLMILIKQALRVKGINRGHFRKMFKSTSDMNNMLRQIENGESLSFARFSEMINKLNLEYDLVVYEKVNGKKQKIV